MLESLSGRRILVTGASGRLGRVAADLLNELGADVVGVDVERPSDSPGQFVQADLMDEAGVIEAFDAAGPVHSVIHTVGTWAGKSFSETSLDDFDQVVRLNMTSTFLVFREAVRRWTRAESGGQLVALASRQGLDGGVAEQAAYSVSKAGVARLIETVGREYADAGITAAGIAPSMILFGEEGEGSKGVPARHVAEMCAMLATEHGGSAHNATVLRAYGSWL